MIRILHYIYGLTIGGAESFIANVIEASDPNSFRFGFAIQNPDITNSRIKSLIKSRDIKIHILPRFPYHLKSQYQALRRVILNNNYNVIHIHANSLVNPVPLMVSARINGLKTLIHSHNSSAQRGGAISLWLHRLNRRLFIRNGFHCIACSEKAARWMFEDKDYSFIPNALHISNYCFTKEGRDRIRNKFSISSGDIVLGSVGRLVYAKNHKFMLEIFRSFNNKCPKSKLMIVGDGSLMVNIQNYAVQLGVDKNVIFAGEQTEIRDYYSSMDCFLITSYFEGLPFTSIEAQANGLPVVVSNSVTREIKLSENVIFTPPRLRKMRSMRMSA